MGAVKPDVIVLWRNEEVDEPAAEPDEVGSPDTVLLGFCPGKVGSSMAKPSSAHSTASSFQKLEVQ